METNSQKAINIAVNLLIFITLLSLAIGLLTATLRLSTDAGKIISDSSAAYVGILEGDVADGYQYTYTDLLSIYSQNVGGDKLDRYYVKYPTQDMRVTLKDYILDSQGGSYSPKSDEQYSRKFLLTITNETIDGQLQAVYTFNANEMP